MQALDKTLKKDGFAATIRQYRQYKWNVWLPAILGYLARGLCVYVLLPYLVVKGL